ncbi:MAG: hypothetical protein JWM78_2040 [Verrucomicrobiaceae bacterium]|nr:hypothetical protein [Verrucomicrobiaceae bacterium]
MPFNKLTVGIALFAFLPIAAFAELGGDVTSVQNDQNRLQAVRRATLSNGYTVHELQTDNGISVREYASTQGKIFAVTWEGPFLPDLQQLLGTYFPTFKAAAEAQRATGARGPLAVTQDDLVVQSGGHMRAYSGKAYVISLIPPQVAIADIQ